MIEIKQSQQTSAYINLPDEKGSKKAAIICTCQIRPGEGMNIMLEVQEKSLLTADNIADVTREIADYLAGEFAKAQSLGIPIAAPAVKPAKKE